MNIADSVKYVSIIKEEYNRYLRSDTMTGFQIGNCFIDFVNMYIVLYQSNGKVKIIPLNF